MKRIAAALGIPAGLCLLILLGFPAAAPLLAQQCPQGYTLSGGKCVVTAATAAPSGAAGGALKGTYPNPELASSFALATTGVFVADQSPASCTISGINYTTRLDCAFFAARAYTIANSLGTTVVLGTNYYPTCATLEGSDIPLYGVSIIGQGRHNSWLVKTCSTPSAPVIKTGENGSPYNMSVANFEGFSVLANSNANACGDFWALQAPIFRDIDCSGVIAGSDHEWQFGETGNWGYGVQDATMLHIFASGDVTPATYASVTANVVGGAITSYTVNSGGSGYISADATVNIVGTRGNTADTPCATMPDLPTVTVSGGAVAALTPGTNKGTTCSGTIYVQVVNRTSITYGFDGATLSDSRIFAAYVQGTKYGINLVGGDNVLDGFHALNTNVGVLDTGGNNAIIGLECDEQQQYCYEKSGAPTSSVIGTNSYTAIVPPGYTTYHLAGGAGNLTLGAQGSLCSAGVPTGYAMIMTSTGTIDSGASVPSGVSLFGDPGAAACGLGGNITGKPFKQFSTGTTHTFSNMYDTFVCTGTCVIKVPVTSPGSQFCALNGDNVSTTITLSAIGSSSRYENTERTAYGTAGTGTFTSAGAVGDAVCIEGLDETHYITVSHVGTWVAN